jgi:hypothetical protein
MLVTVIVVGGTLFTVIVPALTPVAPVLSPLPLADTGIELPTVVVVITQLAEVLVTPIGAVVQLPVFGVVLNEIVPSWFALNEALHVLMYPTIPTVGVHTTELRSVDLIGLIALTITKSSPTVFPRLVFTRFVPGVLGVAPVVGTLPQLRVAVAVPLFTMVQADDTPVAPGTLAVTGVLGRTGVA